jgi:hypothetical protein
LSLHVQIESEDGVWRPHSCVSFTLKRTAEGDRLYVQMQEVRKRWRLVADDATAAASAGVVASGPPELELVSRGA